MALTFILAPLAAVIAHQAVEKLPALTDPHEHTPRCRISKMHIEQRASASTVFTHQTWKEQQVDCFLPETTSIRHLPERLNYEEWTGHGLRVLAVAARAVDKKSAYDLEDERD